VRKNTKNTLKIFFKIFLVEFRLNN